MTATALWPEAEQRMAQIARSRPGRHRDPVLASYRRARAIELRLAGLSYQDIANEVGYANKGTAHAVIRQALDRREADDVAFLRLVETGRLQALLAAIWTRATEGHLPSVRTAAHIVEALCRLEGLDGHRAKDPQAHWPCCQGPATLVTRRDDCRWEGCLKHGKF